MLPLVVVVGPTAVGKTKIGIKIAQSIDGEIISGDSMQVYRGLDIGTAKVKPGEMHGISHHLIDIKEPWETFNAAEFQLLSEEKIKEITARKKVPIIVGGTGLYIQSVIDHYQFSTQETPSEYRKTLQELAVKYGNEYLHVELSKCDPIAAGRIHVNDLRRIIRGLEYYEETGQKISDNKIAYRKDLPPKYDSVIIGLTMDRKQLYERINLRVDKMMEEGFLEEVKALLNSGLNPDLPAFQGLGYRQLVGYLRGLYGLKDAVELIKRDTRHFAKRQLTWFRRDDRIYWLGIDKYVNEEDLLEQILTNIGRTIRINVE